MRNDSIETLLLRHYGHAAPAPVGLEEQLCASVRREAEELYQQKQVATHLRHRRVSRRRAMTLVAMSTAGLGVLSVGLEGLQMLEAALMGQDVTQFTYP